MESIVKSLLSPARVTSADVISSAVVARVPTSVIRPLPSLVGSTKVSNTAVKFPSALISSSTVFAVVAVGSTSIVKMPARMSKLTVATSPNAKLFSITTSTLSNSDPGVTALIVKSLFTSVGSTVAVATSSVVATIPSGLINPLPLLATSTVVSSEAENVPSVLISISTVLAVVAVGS